jgi:hypothetical protein
VEKYKIFLGRGEFSQISLLLYDTSDHHQSLTEKFGGPGPYDLGNSSYYLASSKGFCKKVSFEQGSRNWGGGAGGAAAPVALYQEGRNSELSEMLVQFFYEFASENARNAVISFKNSAIAWQRTPSHTYHPINRKHI